MLKMRAIQRVTIAFLILGVPVGSLYLYAHLLDSRAEFLVRTAYELSEQKGAPPTVATLRGHFGSRLKQLDGCSGSECGYEVFISNRVLAVLHLVPYTEIRSYFWTKDGVIQESMVDYTTTVNHRYNVVAHVQIDFCPGCNSFSLHPWDDSSPLDTNGIVEFGTALSAYKKRSVLSLNTGCLTKLGGCASVAELLPTVWQRTASGRIACRIPNHEGWIDKPAGWP